MNIDIILPYIQRYQRGHEVNFVPPITGIHLAALTPARHRVRVIHQQVDPIPYDTDADLIALSFFSGFAPEAYRLAREFKRRGKIVVAGGPHATFWADEALAHDCDAVVIGEAESVWAHVLDDAARGVLQKKYFGQPTTLENIPTPRYDLLSSRFFVRRVIQATRGCPFACSFCSVPAINPGYRMRPVADVVRDITAEEFSISDFRFSIFFATKYWWQRKVVWFWDDNLTARRAYVKELLCAMIPLKKWWLTQASMDIAQDDELLDLMQASGCIGVFFGIESFGKESLHTANKRHNRVEYYRACIDKVHQRGIAVMAGFIAGFDGDTPADIVAMADRLYEIGVDVPFLSVLTPYKGTALYDQMDADNRLLKARGWQFYNGYNVAFQPHALNADELLRAHRALWRRAFSLADVVRRVARGMLRLRVGALFLSLAMNGFYGWKALRGNAPREMKAEVGRMKDEKESTGFHLSSLILHPLNSE
ncbi:MAG: B12-binding domain-containing radical SAM protein [Chloroflexi bacterium]|nr:B12-binding domain-containing radical SAM protein [Chloroflexota bacterium]